MLFHYFAACRKLFRILHPDSPKKDADIWASFQVINLNRTFRPPLPTNKVTDAMNQRKVGFRRSNTRNAIVARDLKVTPEEVDAIGLQSTVPGDIAEQRKSQASEQKTETATLKAAEQTAIDALIAGGESDASIAKKLGTDRQKVRYRRQRLDRLEKEKNLPLPFSPAQP
jgi:alpha-beta hydrolase superfamily lysophospholipase